MATRKVNTEYKKLVSLFNNLTGSRSLWNVFNDCIEMFALSIQNTCSFDNFQKREMRYKDIAKNYSKNEFDIILQIFAEIVNKIEENPFRDFLGDSICNSTWAVMHSVSFLHRMLCHMYWQRLSLTIKKPETELKRTDISRFTNLVLAVALM